uniref:Lysosomal dipeptide transporter MFSD1 n=1 Tax=Sinocyclocheilus grahami TaxID=75366 RepID=A0A672M9Q2_SINGR
MAAREEYAGLLEEDEEEEEDEGVSRHLSPLCDPTHLLHRILVLLFMCFLGFGSYFCYDNPAALQTQFIQDMSLNTASFMLLYAWYSWPNVVLCFLGGFLLDRVFGIRLGTIIFASFVLVGQRLLIKMHFMFLWLCVNMRDLFSIGGESLAVAQNTYAVNWFKGKELNLVFGLQLSMARVGSTVNMNVIGWVYGRIEAMLGSAGHTTLGITLMIAASTCLFSLTCALILGFLDRRAEKILHKEQGKTGEVIKLTDVKDFPFSLWLIFIICVAYYVAIFPFIGLGQVFFIEKFAFTTVQARAINSIVYIISAPASPLLGFVVDRTGRNILWVMLAVASTLLAHMMLAFTFWNPWIAMCLLGLSYSLLACALWPMVAFVVPEHQLGTAYGFMQSIQNLGLALMSMAAGSILDLKGYLFLEVFFIACLCLALLAVVLLYLRSSRFLRFCCQRES